MKNKIILFAVAFLFLINGVIAPLDETPISNCEELDYIFDADADNIYNFYLTNNINCSGYTRELVGGERISYEGASNFNGYFDGHGYNISNLYINSSVAGLFTNFSNFSVILNVGLINLTIITAGDYAGGIAGIDSFSSKIQNCFVEGTINGNENVGGLIGQGSIGTTISKSYFKGDITGSNYVGGLVGNNTGNITNSYAIGSINGENYIGGLVGYSNYDLIINSSYAVEDITATGISGGLIAYNGSSLICDTSYWDTDVGVGTSACGDGKTTEEMVLNATYVGWDFISLWQIDEGVTYPYLYFEGSGYEAEFPPEIIPEPAYKSGTIYRLSEDAGAGISSFMLYITSPLVQFLIIITVVVTMIVGIMYALIGMLKHYFKYTIKK